MSSKQVTDREKSATALLAIIEGQLEALIIASSQQLSPLLWQGEALPDLGLTFALAGRAVKQSLDAMRAATQTHIEEQSDDGPILEARDTKAQQLSEKLIKLRQAASTTYGATSLIPLGFSKQTPQDHTALVRFAQGVTSAFRRGPLPATEEGVFLDPTSRLDAIDQDATRLEELLKEVAKEKREAQKTQDDKNKAIAAYDATFSRVAHFFVGAFRLAGLEELAKKVRPSNRRPGQLIPENEEEDTAKP
jgi:hypothetical protein